MRMLDNFRNMLNERRARAAVDTAQPTLARTVAGMDLAERAALMIVAHAILRDATQDYGMAVVANPSKLAKDKVAELLARLGGAHRRLSAALAAAEEHVAGADVVYAGVLRQIRATEVAIVTVGIGFDRTLVPVVKQTWRWLWQARTHAVDGVRLIRTFERAMHQRALPDSQPKDPEKMARLATRLPEMFRAARPGEAAGAKTAAAKAAATGTAAVRPPPSAKSGAARPGAAKPAARPGSPAGARPASGRTE